MRAIRVAVVDDDPASCQRIASYLERYSLEQGEHFETATFTNGLEFVDGYAPLYDILLLDIQMKPIDGVEVARQVRRKDQSVVIVFITSAPQYAINGYEVGALSYLLKPLPWFAFSQEIKRSIAQVRGRVEESIIVGEAGKSTRVTLHDIVYVESVRHTSVMHTLSRDLTLNTALKDLQSQLESKGFFRSNSCYLVNMAHVVGVEDQESIMSTGEHLRVSRPRKKTFLEALASYIGGQE
ncbi:DNA-binding response regulator [Bombiscardovia apis]|uniref:DNA-binding response regulator n=1 Tax=Bombiscardovia apis TaxID=2932182 RepID=A0ABM8BBC1_9BIFI|nr:LytTR family DNA-binding domain-containing protein [Bombiscardovia apis]BDR53902.1 DNA-binding response regulator [Bombiscardovia apis]